MNECIKRSAVMEQIKELLEVDVSFINADYDIGFHAAALRMRSAIEEMPVEEAEPVVRARWECVDYWAKKKGRRIHFVTKRCSNCHCAKKKKSSQPDRCHHCGAYMDGSDNDGCDQIESLPILPDR